MPFPPWVKHKQNNLWLVGPSRYDRMFWRETMSSWHSTGCYSDMHHTLCPLPDDLSSSGSGPKRLYRSRPSLHQQSLRSLPSRSASRPRHRELRPDGCQRCNYTLDFLTGLVFFFFFALLPDKLSKQPPTKLGSSDKAKTQQSRGLEIIYIYHLGNFDGFFFLSIDFYWNSLTVIFIYIHWTFAFQFHFVFGLLIYHCTVLLNIKCTAMKYNVEDETKSNTSRPKTLLKHIETMCSYYQ